MSRKTTPLTDTQIKASKAKSKDYTIAFLIAVTFSYFFNAEYNFKTEFNLVRYLWFVFFMVFLAYLTGFIADMLT